MQIGIVGLPLSGKTALFNALTHGNAETGLGSGRRNTNLGSVEVPDPRLDRIADLADSAKKTPTTVSYVDVAGMEQATGKEHGFSDRFLSNLRLVDALVFVLRAFADESIPHPHGSIDPRRDFATIETEFLLSDLVVVERRLERIARAMKKADSPPLAAERELLERCRVQLESEQPLRELDFSEEERRRMKGFQFLTDKPLLILLNISEQDLPRAKQIEREFRSTIRSSRMAVAALSARIEMEIAQLDEKDATEFLHELGIQEPALHRLIRMSYGLLDLVTYFTAGETESRAWTIRRGTTARAAAREIHSDLERGFIRAEVVAYNDFVRFEGFAGARQRGLLRLEGRDYVVQDGDIMTFRFSV